ncbi:MAG: IPT/TIG domain-containing protein [Candidatus Eremiobacteraeota bacterium]|nr:IPT/TIG domain-containing protein [Candidatus Eremiobacteraeota bacterium]
MRNLKLKIILLIVGLLIITLVSQAWCSEDVLKFYGPKPNYGGPGETVDLRGDGFGATMGKSNVFFGSVKADVISWSHNEISVLVPNNVSPDEIKEVKKRRRMKKLLPVHVYIEGSGKSEIKYFDILPRIGRISPNNGGPGEKITIKGKNFGNYIDIGKVFVGTTEAKVEKWTKKSITCTLPSSVNPDKIHTNRRKRRKIDVYVHVAKLKGPGKEFGWDPHISSVYPKKAGPGTKVEISGRNFGILLSSVKVVFGSIQTKPYSLEENLICVNVPKNISGDDLKDGTLPVRVVVGGVNSNEKSIVPGPEITKVHPRRSKGGVIIIMGSNFGYHQKGNRVVFITEAKDVPGKFEAKIIDWTQEEIKVEIPSEKNPTGEDVIYKVKIYSGDLNSNEKEHRYQSHIRKETKEKIEEIKSDREVEKKKKETPKKGK